MSKRSTYSPAQRLQQSATALELHATGLTERQVAETMGLSQATVHRRLLDGLEAFTIPSGDKAKAAALSRLETLYSLLQPQLAAGNRAAIETALKLEQQKAKLLGLEAPKQSEVTKKSNGFDDLFSMLDQVNDVANETTK